jgi:hypothetical protein
MFGSNGLTQPSCCMAEQNLKEKGKTKNPRRKQSSTKPETEEEQTI